MKFGTIAGSFVFSSCLGLTVVGQQPQPNAPGVQPRSNNPTQTPSQTGTQRNDIKGNDDTLAHCLIVDNQAEIALARMAESKSQNQEVKKLASMFQKEHQAFVQKLQTFSPNTRGDVFQSNSSSSGQDVDRSNPGNPNERTNLKPATPTPNTQNSAQTNQQPNNVAGGNNQLQQPAGNASLQGDRGMNLNQIHQELAQQCLSDAQKKLSKENGEEFDKCFVGMQLAMHAGMLSKLTVFERHASNELTQVLNEGKQATQKHMEHAESIMKQLAGDADKSGEDKKSRKDSSSNEENRSNTKDR